LSVDNHDLIARYSTYPKPAIPVSPVLSWRSLGSGKTSVSSILNVKNIRLATSGRCAIALALKALGVKDGDKVLLPAYHCTSMVDPVDWLGAKSTFYRIKPDTSVDFDSIEQLIDEKTRVLLITHYFGFPQSSAKIRAFCDANGLALIEDCAHAFFGSKDERPIGGYGDFAIASSMKFFPIYDGGILASMNHSLTDIPTTSAGFLFEAKTALNVIENALAYNRLKVLRPLITWPLWLKDKIWSLIKSPGVDKKASTIGPAASDGGYGFDPDWVSKSMSLASDYVLKHTNTARLVEQRRANYLAMYEALADEPGITPLYNCLPETVVPYVLPMLVDEPEVVFHELKSLGVPVLRFGEFLCDGVDETICPVSMDLSRRVFQFPCHQELNREELDWMVNTIRNILRNKKIKD